MVFCNFYGVFGHLSGFFMKMPILHGYWDWVLPKGLGIGKWGLMYVMGFGYEGLMCMVVFGKWVRHTVCMGKGHTKRGIEDISYGMSFLPLLFLENNQFIMMDNKCLLLSCKGFDLSSDHSPCKGINQRLHLHLFLQ